MLILKMNKLELKDGYKKFKVKNEYKDIEIILIKS